MFCETPDEPAGAETQGDSGGIDGRAAEIGDVAAGEAQIVVFDLQRPGGRQCLLNAEADGPAPERGVGAVRGDGRSGKPGQIIVGRHVDLVTGPRHAGLAVDQGGRAKRQYADRCDIVQFVGRTHGVADPAGQRGDGLRANPAGGVDGQGRSGKARAGAVGRDGVAIGFDAEDPLPFGRLPIEADLTSGHRPGAAHGVAENGGAKGIGEVGRSKRQARVCPDIEPGPIPD